MQLQLTPGSILLMSGESRWDWLHRVVPKQLENEQHQYPFHRMSLVLGCKLQFSHLKYTAKYYSTSNNT
jgi:hypothetical protein